MPLEYRPSERQISIPLVKGGLQDRSTPYGEGTPP